MYIEITEDYLDIIKDIAKYAGVEGKQVKILSDTESEIEYICDHKEKIIAQLNNQFWDWLNGDVELVELKNPVCYMKILYDNENDPRRNDVYEKIITVNGHSYMRLVYTEIEDQLELIGENFHWSDVCAPAEYISEFIEEESYWMEN